MATAARRGLARGILAPLRPAPFPVRTTPALARAASNIRSQMREAKSRGNKEMLRGDASAPSPAAEMAGQTDMLRNKFLLPGTFVRLPVTKWPRDPKSFFKYLYAVLHSKAQTFFITFGLRAVSIPKGAFRPAFRAQKRQIVPTAVALHRRLNEAIAAGDLAALREVCHDPLYDMLSRSIAGRKKGEKLSWELVENHTRLLLPRLVFHRATMVPDSRYGQHNAVVRFDTTQKLTKRDAKGNLVKGGMKAQRKTENMVLMRAIDSKGYKPEPWKVWGFEDAMTLDQWETMEEGKKALERSELGKKAKEMGLEAPTKR